jgi:hypothetical protein
MTVEEFGLMVVGCNMADELMIGAWWLAVVVVVACRLRFDNSSRGGMVVVAMEI